MRLDKKIEKVLYQNMKKIYSKKQIIIKRLKVDRREGYVFKIEINYKSTIYYAKYYSNKEKIYEIADFNKYQFDSDKYLIARPIFIFDDIQTVIFYKISGIKFSYLIPFVLSPAYFLYKNIVNKIIREITNCLVYFQKNSNPDIWKSIDIDFTLFGLKKIELLDNFEKSKIANVLKNMNNYIGELPLLFNHNDFVSKNILISKEFIGLIDIDRFGFDNRLFDIHSFIFNLELKTINPIYSKKIVKRILKEFFLEYRKFYPIKLTKEILLYTKLIYLVLFLFEKQKLEERRNYKDIKAFFIMKELRKDIISTINLLKN